MLKTNNLESNKKIIIKNVVLYLSIAWFFFCIGCFLLIIFLYWHEAYFQKEIYKSKSKGDCRIVNTKIAYENNYILVTDKLIKNNQHLYHTYAIDEYNRIHDNSNGKSETVAYEEFQKRQDFNDRIFSAKFEKGVLTNIQIYDYYNINAYFSYLNTKVHYYTYK